MSIVDPTLLHLFGNGFLGDVYAADGPHMRWAFDSRLGFPRRAFCLQRSASKLRETIARDASHKEAMPTSRATIKMSEVLGSQTSLIVAGDDLSVSPLGVQVTKPTMVLDMHGGAAQDASPIFWVRLNFWMLPGAHVSAQGVLHGWARDSYVAAAEQTDSRRAWWWDLIASVHASASASAAPSSAKASVRARSPDLKRTLASDQSMVRDAVALTHPEMAGRLSSDVLKRLTAAVHTKGIAFANLLAYISKPQPMALTLVASRIDAIELSGTGAWLASVQWMTVAEYQKFDGKWEPVDCYPILTNNPEYRKRNENVLHGPLKDLAHKLLTGPTRPLGAEPLDEARVPATRAATDAELTERYLYPWIEQLEPWISEVLSKSSGGALHQSEISKTVPMDEISSPGGANVAGSVGAMQDLQMPLYPMLLAASLAFQVARQLGLACVVANLDPQDYDYRLSGWWRAEDLLAWPASLQRRAQQLSQAAPNETPAQASQRLVDLIAAMSEFSVASAAINALIALGGGGPEIRIDAYAFGISIEKRPLFVSPSALNVMQRGSVAPPAPGNPEQGLADMSWPLRARAGVADDSAIPVGATLARTRQGSGEPFSDVLNTPSRFGRPAAVVTIQDPLAPGGAGTTHYWDRHVPENTSLTYGVSECDPFGRWSAFTSVDSRWDHIVPPPPPALSATLAPNTLTTQVAWPPPGHLSLAGASLMTLRLHLRRDLPVPPSDPSFNSVVRDPGQWPHCARVDGGTTPLFSFPASTTTAVSTTSSDAMTITVVPDTGGFRVRFDNIDMAPNPGGRSRIYVVATAIDSAGVASTECGGPALAEFVAVQAPAVPHLQVNPEPLLATYPDALDRSTRTFSFTSVAGTRYTLLRAGEYDVVSAAQAAGVSVIAYQSATTPADRAAALKLLSLHTRDAFTAGPVADATGVSTSLSDTLAGGLRTLTVYTVSGRSANGSPSPWPNSAEAFAVVAVPQIPPPSTPLVVRGEWKPADPVSSDVEQQVSHVELTIAAPPPGTGPVVCYEVYRTTNPALASDVRRMTPLHVLTVPSDTALLPWTDATLAGGTAKVVVWRDAHVDDWTTGWYRVVARGPAPNGATGVRGTRSAASPVQQVKCAADSVPIPTSATLALTARIAPVFPSTLATPPMLTTNIVATIPDESAGTFRAVVRQVLVDGKRVGVATATLVDGGPNILIGSFLAPTSGQNVTIEVTIIDPLAREGAPLSISAAMP